MVPDPSTPAREAAEAAQVQDGEGAAVPAEVWHRARLREMLGAGWSARELADVGITPAMLHRLGLGAEARALVVTPEAESRSTPGGSAS
jgi:hypothetical protein